MLCLAFLAAPAASDPVESLADAAAVHREAGRFAEAIVAYLRAYELGPEANLLYNVAYIYDKDLKNAERAREFYRRYAIAKDALPDLRVLAIERLEVLAVESVEPEVREVVREVEVIREVERPAPLVLAPPPPPPDAARAWGWSVLGVGAASTLTGVAFTVLAAQSEDERASASDALERQALADESSERAALGHVSLAIGALGLVSGALLLFLDDEALAADAGGPLFRF